MIPITIFIDVVILKTMNWSYQDGTKNDDRKADEQLFRLQLNTYPQ